VSTTNGELVAEVRQALETARQDGRPAPGRPTLVRLTGATDHAVRKALAELAAEDRQPGNQAGEAGDDHTSDQPAPVPPGGRLVAWAGFVFGSVMSIAANVLHAWLPATHEPPGWSPGIAPQVGAAAWPIGLMLAVEALSRIHWPKGVLWGLARFGGAGAVAVGSAVISYGHLRDLLMAWHYGPLAAAVGPLVLDGLMVVCGFALLAISHTKPGDAGADRQ
jgi:hypothetical protein